jgi:hypothetical protein
MPANAESKRRKFRAEVKTCEVQTQARKASTSFTALHRVVDASHFMVGHLHGMGVMSPLARCKSLFVFLSFLSTTLV